MHPGCRVRGIGGPSGVDVTGWDARMGVGWMGRESGTFRYLSLSEKRTRGNGEVTLRYKQHNSIYNMEAARIKGLGRNDVG